MSPEDSHVCCKAYKGVSPPDSKSIFRLLSTNVRVLWTHFKGFVENSNTFRKSIVKYMP